MALHLENITHAVISFAVALVALSALYFYVEAPFAAIFQLVVGAGTIAVFLLAGEMLSPKGEKAQRL
ncbi:MAG: NADH-quinone oxidoreductase subunit J, partial [Candidatus Brockarchaeota archaeon]|nr:NADH-quinone oxidoreductase subunit J [Candidatus Brockarchaeota archaeon]